MRPNLVAVPSSGLHDLPPRWDGHAVAWRGWQSIEGFVCGRAGRTVCECCGSVENPTINVGSVADDSTMTQADAERDQEAMRLACSMRVVRQRRTWIRLTAFRCVECGADTVVDDQGVWWKLDVSDYGDAGSVAPENGSRDAQ